MRTEQVGVFGGGTMGAGIAHAFLTSGSEVVVIENDAKAADAAAERVRRLLEKSAEHGVLEETPEAVVARLRVSTDASALAPTGLVVEAVPEIPALKASVLATIEAEAPNAVVASNTSSLSIDDLAAVLERPGRFIGMHFFNPVPRSDLIEVVRGAATDESVVAEVTECVTRLGRTPIVVSDSPGFASSRLGLAIALEAMRMLEEGVASAEDIDTAMTLGYRHPVGPLKTTDIVGLDVRLAIAEYLAERLGPRFAPPALLKEKVAAGELGRKTGRGFYDW